MKFVKIPIDELRLMKEKGFKELVPYTHPNRLVRWIFWKRLETLLKLAKPADKVLDFGAGSGIFTPSLSANFKEVYCLDLNLDSIRYVKDKYNLKNVEIFESLKTNELPFHDNFFDVIFAADVLEHFHDSSPILEEFCRVLKDDGMIIISGPTENGFYITARELIFRHKKPADHYTDINDIITKTKKLFFIDKKIVLPSRLIPGFIIYSAKKIINKE